MGIGFGHQSRAGVNKMQPLKIPLAFIRWKLSKRAANKYGVDIRSYIQHN